MPAEQVPVGHSAELVVQAEPLIGVCTQPPTGSQESAVQALPSLQGFRAPLRQAPAAQLSPTVQTSLSSQVMVLAVYSQAPPEHSCRPAVDFLLRSVAQVYGGSCIAVILTGMGCDGLAGCQLLHDAGARVFAQDEATCTVFGMPRGPIERGIAEAVPLHDMANHIQLAAKVAQLR